MSNIIELLGAKQNSHIIWSNWDGEVVLIPAYCWLNERELKVWNEFRSSLLPRHLPHQIPLSPVCLLQALKRELILAESMQEGGRWSTCSVHRQESHVRWSEHVALMSRATIGYKAHFVFNFTILFHLFPSTTRCCPMVVSHIVVLARLSNSWPSSDC